MATSLAEQSERLGLHDHAARLYDLSGDDSRLASFLSKISSSAQHGVGTSDSPPAADAAVQQLRALQAISMASPPGLGREVGGVGDASSNSLFRRSTLLAGVSRLPQVLTRRFLYKSLPQVPLSTAGVQKGLLYTVPHRSVQ